MTSSVRILSTALLLSSSVSALTAASEADAAAGRALVKRYADAIVGVELVVTTKMKMGERELPPREQRLEANGTVISASGLTVTSLAAVDPQASFDASRMGGQGGRGPELVGVEFKEVKLRLADGKEVPARFVLKDSDLDLAFMAPEAGGDAPKREFSFVKLDAVAEGAVLGSYFSIGRAGKALQRVPIVRPTDVIGVVEKPRRFYLLSDQTSMGTPVFDLAGQVLGVTLQYFAGGRVAAIVLPAADIGEMAKLAAAAQAKPTETKSEAAP